jgi:ribonuclease-3
MAEDLGKGVKDLAAMLAAIGITFRQPALLRRALTHASYLNENPGCDWGDNERLEFLGDAVGDFIAAEFLYHRFPEWQEGPLTSLRAELVRSETLARFAKEIDLGRYLLLGRGEEQGGGRIRATMLGDAFEALLGALYLDQGLEATTEFFGPFLRSHLEASSAEALPRDAKTRLQEWAQATYHEAPAYVTVQAAGPDHAKQFTVEVLIMGQVRGQGAGNSKQAAEQAAAQAALDAIAAQTSQATHADE